MIAKNKAGKGGNKINMNEKGIVIPGYLK